MQSENSFELNRAIQRWRENLGRSPVFRHENLNELEAHLRDSVVASRSGRIFSSRYSSMPCARC